MLPPRAGWQHLGGNIWVATFDAAWWQQSSTHQISLGRILRNGFAADSPELIESCVKKSLMAGQWAPCLTANAQAGGSRLRLCASTRHGQDVLQQRLASMSVARATMESTEPRSLAAPYWGWKLLAALNPNAQKGPDGQAAGTPAPRSAQQPATTFRVCQDNAQKFKHNDALTRSWQRRLQETFRAPTRSIPPWRCGSRAAVVTTWLPSTSSEMISAAA